MGEFLDNYGRIIVSVIIVLALAGFVAATFTPQFQTAIDQLHDSSPKYCGALLSVFPEARATVESEIESMLNGKEDVDTAVQKMSDTINKSIKDYNTVNN